MILDGALFREIQTTAGTPGAGWKTARRQAWTSGALDGAGDVQLSGRAGTHARPGDLVERSRGVGRGSTPNRFVGRAPSRSEHRAVDLRARTLHERSQARRRADGTHVHGWSLATPTSSRSSKAAADLGACVFGIRGTSSARTDDEVLAAVAGGMPHRNRAGDLLRQYSAASLERCPSCGSPSRMGWIVFPGRSGRIQHGFNSRPDSAPSTSGAPQELPRTLLRGFPCAHADALREPRPPHRSGEIALGSDYPFPRRGDARQLIESIAEFDAEDARATSRRDGARVPRGVPRAVPG